MKVAIIANYWKNSLCGEIKNYLTNLVRSYKTTTATWGLN